MNKPREGQEVRYHHRDTPLLNPNRLLPQFTLLIVKKLHITIKLMLDLFWKDWSLLVFAVGKRKSTVSSWRGIKRKWMGRGTIRGHTRTLKQWQAIKHVKNRDGWRELEVLAHARLPVRVTRVGTSSSIDGCHPTEHIEKLPGDPSQIGLEAVRDKRRGEG